MHEDESASAKNKEYKSRSVKHKEYSSEKAKAKTRNLRSKKERKGKSWREFRPGEQKRKREDPKKQVTSSANRQMLRRMENQMDEKLEHGLWTDE
jgi:hypothetical protein